MYFLGQYVPGDSVVHRLDPRVKIISVMGLSIMILGATFPGALLVSVLFAVLALNAHLTPRCLLQALRAVLIFLVLFFLMHLLLTEGTPIPPFPRGAVTPTYEGLIKGARVVWQFSLLILFGVLLTLSTSPTAMISGIERMLRPLRILRIPSHDVAIMISMAFRFVPAFLQELQRIKEAQLARGAEFRSSNLFQKARSTARILPPLILSFLRRADDLAAAMEARGYQRGPRTYLNQLRLSRTDFTAVLVMALVAGFYVFLTHFF